MDGAASQWEERSTASGNLHGYTNRSIPWGDNPANPTIFDILEVNYYDRYEGIPGIPDNPSTGHSKLTHGRLVARKVKVIGTSSTYLWTVYYYDDRGNVTGTYSQHYKGGTVTGNYDRTATTYTFTGRVKLVSRKHFVGGTQELQVNTDHVYDHRERLVDTWMQVNAGSTSFHISRNHYNEVEQVWKKENNGTDGVTLNYATAYTYNERGWLRTANGTLFNQELRYNTGSTKYFSGNIAYQVFSRKHTTGSTVSGTYTYTYDGANRLLTGTMAGNQGREILTYDRNGNIRTLRRTNQSGVTVDSLLYNYTGNRLTSVNDRSTNGDLQFMLRGVTTYTHDANGNVTKRTNPTASGDDITGTVYNQLDLPQTVSASGATVTYTYDGSGRKLRSVNGINGQTRDYVDGIEYSGGTLELIQMPEGRILKSGSNYTYEYMLRDHLGNTRSAFAGSVTGTAKFGMDYYPFGLQYPGSMGPGSPKNNYLYNGKELQDKLKQYDYGARFYDPVIGRWNVVDPMAENYYSSTPYNYVDNNPVLRIDPNGMDWKSTHTDRWGNVLAIYDDGDLGVYKHDDATSKNEVDEKRKSGGTTSGGGKHMGETWTPFGFADFEYFQDNGVDSDGSVKVGRGAKIDFDSDWAFYEVRDILSKNPSAYEYSTKAGGYGDWDIKRNSPGGYYYGSKLYGRYASARDAGNFAAGAIAERSMMPNLILDYGFGLYNQSNNRKGVAAIMGMLDYYTGSLQPLMGFGLLNYRASYGEDILSRHGIDAGRRYIKR